MNESIQSQPAQRLLTPTQLSNLLVEHCIMVSPNETRSIEQVARDYGVLPVAAVVGKDTATDKITV